MSAVGYQRAEVDGTRSGPGGENVRFVVESENQTDNRLRQGWIRRILILAHPSITPSHRTFLVQGHSLAK
jgi:hypothetical protein